jgi:UDPglucose 6-dehydrogenase
MKIAVIGTGYVGLVSGVCFSEFGFNVVCIDNNASKIDQLNRGCVPIYEPGLDKLMLKNTNAGRLSFSKDLTENVANANIVFIAVGTPSNADGSADLSYVYGVVDKISEHLKAETVLVIKSTVPVGTTRSVKTLLMKKGVNVDVAFNPEFLREGAAVDDFMRPDRVILGIDGERSKKILANVYRPLYVFNTPIVFTTLESAELSKYASNAFLAMKIAFINEMANLCESCRADVNDVAISMGLDKRIGDKFLQAGPGYGGSCFPKDTVALRNFASNFGVEMSLVNATIQSNQNRRNHMIKKILLACNNEVDGKNISILGITFKANTDDIRDSPGIEIINALVGMNANIRIYDPSFSESAKSIFPHVTWSNSVYDNCNNADAIIIITDWAEFRAINLPELKKRVKNPLLIDLRNMYDISDVESSGFRYCCIGRFHENC